ncbi:PhzF family phenazine biosynthesis protein [Undibacterium sp. Di27W]|uniref:PhzF family phenazine biosynthesis protein n=1 Tax=Undibacterium sp. Di27W TaxID=3413036 RepID=UPI003BEFF708
MKKQIFPFSMVDVFARQTLAGNGLSIFVLEQTLSTYMMQAMTREMRQFETIFLQKLEGQNKWRAHIFTMEEELGFAGHPIIGAAASLHQRFYPEATSAEFEFVLNERSVFASSRQEQGHFFAEMNQGKASFGEPLTASACESFFKALNLHVHDKVTDLPLQVVSTGLPYLIVPIQQHLDKARICHEKFEALLAGVGAKFVYVLDVQRREGRTWDNEGKVEDIATGSAVGPAAAYLVRHQRAQAGVTQVFVQGAYVHRSSELHVTCNAVDETVLVRGQVCMVAQGELYV